MSKKTATGRMWTRGNWRPVPDLPGVEASYSGRIRYVLGDRPRVLFPAGIGPCGFYTMSVPGSAKVHQVGKLAATAWYGPIPEGLVVRYLDGNLQNHTVSNLAYGTREQMLLDQVERALIEESNGAPTHCEYGHRYELYWSSGWGERTCKTCVRQFSEIERVRGRQEEDHACHRCDELMTAQTDGSKVCQDCKTAVSKSIRDTECTRCGSEMLGVPYQRKICDKCNESRGTFQDKDCMRCGDLMEGVHFTRLVCDPCKAARRPGVIQTKDCLDCGEVLQGVHYKRLYCDYCLQVRYENSRAESAKRRLKPPRNTTCCDCSAQITVNGTGPLPKRCACCKKEAMREASRRFEEKRKRIRNAKRK